MITSSNIILKGENDRAILLDYEHQETIKPLPVVVFCHGYKGYKDWGAWNLAAEEFTNADMFFVKFNFSHNGGTLQNPIDFPDLESFGQNNFTIELNDLENVIDWVSSNQDFHNEIDINDITLIGHSRGGGIVTIKASENSKVTKLISWAGVSDFASRFPSGELLSGWEKAGVSFIENARTKQQMPHYFQFYTNFKKYEELLTIKNAVSNLKIPHLIIQGENDEVVPLKEAENLHLWNPQSELKVIKEMNHPLGCTQPWENTQMPEHLKQVVKFSIDFIKAKS